MYTSQRDKCKKNTVHKKYKNDKLNNIAFFDRVQQLLYNVTKEKVVGSSQSHYTVISAFRKTRTEKNVNTSGKAKEHYQMNSSVKLNQP